MQRLRSLSRTSKSKDIEFNRLDLGRILLLARSCFSKLRKSTLQKQYGNTGILRESPAEDVAHQMIQDVYALLIRTQPRLSEIFSKPPYENVNLLFRLLSTFLKNADILQVTETSEYYLFDADNHQEDAFTQYLQQLAASDNPKLSVLAELLHEILHFSVTVLNAQLSAENPHLDIHGMTVLMTPLLCSLLNRAGNSYDFINMLGFTEREFQHRLSTARLPFYKANSDCYHKNTRHMTKDTNPDLIQLALNFRKLFSEMVELRSQLNKQWSSLFDLSVKFDNTPLPIKKRTKILDEIHQSYDNAKDELAEKLERLETLYHQLSRASVLQADQNGGQYFGDVSREAAGLAFFKSQSQSHGSLPRGNIPASKHHEKRICKSYDALPKPQEFIPSFIDEEAASMSSDAHSQKVFVSSLPSELARAAVLANEKRQLRSTDIVNSLAESTRLEETTQDTLPPRALPDLPDEKYKSLLSDLIQQLGALGDEADDADDTEEDDEPVIPDLSDLGSSSYMQP